MYIYICVYIYRERERGRYIQAAVDLSDLFLFFSLMISKLSHSMAKLGMNSTCQRDVEFHPKDGREKHCQGCSIFLVGGNVW